MSFLFRSFAHSNMHIPYWRIRAIRHCTHSFRVHIQYEIEFHTHSLFSIATGWGGGGRGINGICKRNSKKNQLDERRRNSSSSSSTSIIEWTQKYENCLPFESSASKVNVWKKNLAQSNITFGKSDDTEAALRRVQCRRTKSSLKLSSIAIIS